MIWVSSSRRIPCVPIHLHNRSSRVTWRTKPGLAAWGLPPGRGAIARPEAPGRQRGSLPAVHLQCMHTRGEDGSAAGRSGAHHHGRCRLSPSHGRLDHGRWWCLWPVWRFGWGTISNALPDFQPKDTTYGVTSWRLSETAAGDGQGSRPPGSAGRQPGGEIGGTAEIQQRFCQCLQLLQWQRLDPGGGGFAQGAAAAVELAERVLMPGFGAATRQGPGGRRALSGAGG